MGSGTHLLKFDGFPGTHGTRVLMSLQCPVYRVVKQNFQVVRFRDFEHMRTRMAQVFCITSRHNIYLLIQSKKLRSEAMTSPES